MLAKLLSAFVYKAVGMKYNLSASPSSENSFCITKIRSYVFDHIQIVGNKR